MEYKVLKENEVFIIENLIHEEGFDKRSNNLYGRVISSFENILVCEDNNPIGFINLLTESTDDFVFMDLFLIKSAQSKGYGTKITKDVMGWFKDKDEILIAQPEIINRKSNKILLNQGSLVMHFNGYNYYVLSDIKKLTEDKMQKLIDHRYYGYKGEIPNKKDYVLFKRND